MFSTIKNKLIIVTMGCFLLVSFLLFHLVYAESTTKNYSVEGKHINIETVFTPTSNQIESIKKQVQFIDIAYELLSGLFNSTPYNGKKITVLYDPSAQPKGVIVVGGEAIAWSGNPVTYKGYPLSTEESDWYIQLRNIFHELAHDFTETPKKKLDDYPPSVIEAFAELGQTHVIRNLIIKGNTEFEKVYQRDKFVMALENYKKGISPFSKNDYLARYEHLNILTGMLLTLQEKYGDEFLKDFTKALLEETGLAGWITPGATWMNGFAQLLSISSGKSFRAEFEKWDFPLHIDSDGDNLNDGQEIDLFTKIALPDSDNDCIPDGKEFENKVNIVDLDSDSDGLLDGYEVGLGLDPLIKSDVTMLFQEKDYETMGDEDGDGLSRVQEINIGTNPYRRDTDRDGLNDGEELKFGLDPIKFDTNGNNYLDKCEVEKLVKDIVENATKKVGEAIGKSIDVSNASYSLRIARWNLGEEGYGIDYFNAKEWAEEAYKEAEQAIETGTQAIEEMGAGQTIEETEKEAVPKAKESIRRYVSLMFVIIFIVIVVVLLFLKLKKRRKSGHTI